MQSRWRNGDHPNPVCADPRQVQPHAERHVDRITGRPEPYNVAVVLDTTPSMTDTDSSCSNKTQLQCAVVGIQNLLLGLEPSLDSVSLFTFPNLYTTDVSNEYNCAGTNNLTVPPYTFPYASATTMTTMPYTYTTYTYNRNGQVTGSSTTTKQATYQVVDYSNDYKSSDAATTLNSGSNLVKAVGGKSGCSSMGPVTRTPITPERSTLRSLRWWPSR